VLGGGACFTLFFNDVGGFWWCDKKKIMWVGVCWGGGGGGGGGGELHLQLMALIRRHVFSDPLLISQRHFTSVNSLRQPICRRQSHADTAIPGLAWAPTAHYHKFRM